MGSVGSSILFLETTSETDKQDRGEWCDWSINLVGRFGYEGHDCKTDSELGSVLGAMTQELDKVQREQPRRDILGREDER